jgi:hypothetical protein
MIFDLEQEEGERVQFFTSSVDPSTGKITYDDPVDDAWVELRPMQPFFEERIAKRKKITEWVHDPKTRQLTRQTYYPELSVDEAKKERDDAWDYAITGFGNFKDKTGAIIECTRENKLKMIKNPVFIRFCERCFEVMANSGVSKEVEEKNLQTGSDGMMSKAEPVLKKKTAQL